MSATKIWLRTAIFGSLPLLLIGCGASDTSFEGAEATASTAAAATTLKDAAAGEDGFKMRYFGAAVYKGFASNTSLSNVLKNEFSSLTWENAGKWDSTEPNQPPSGQLNPENKFVFDSEMPTFAKQNNMKIRGHCLVWKNMQTPQWVKNISDKQRLIDVMKNHITIEMLHYKTNNFIAWDVVNEAYLQGGQLRANQTINDPNYPDVTSSDEQSVFGTTIGEDFIKIAFEAANDAANKIEAEGYTRPMLCYNDYEIERVNTKSNTIYSKLATLNNDSAHPGRQLVDCIGMQGHFRYDQVNKRPNAIADEESDTENMRRFDDLGLMVQVTEVDVRLNVNDSGVSQDENLRRIVTACGLTGKCMGITTWGVTDDRSWIPESEQPLLFDRNFGKKGMYNTVLNTLNELVSGDWGYQIWREWGQIFVNWKGRENGAESKFYVERRDPGAEKFKNVATVDVNSWPYYGVTDANVTIGKTYTYRVRVTNSAGEHLYTLPEMAATAR